MSEGLEYLPTLEQLYISGRWSGFRWVVGHYEIGFGERLTFDTTGKIKTNWMGSSPKVGYLGTTVDSITVNHCSEAVYLGLHFDADGLGRL